MFLPADHVASAFNSLSGDISFELGLDDFLYISPAPGYNVFQLEGVHRSLQSCGPDVMPPKQDK